MTQTNIEKYAGESVIDRQIERRRGSRAGAVWSLVVLIATGGFSGCAALTNPVANGVPVHMVPDELLAPSKEGLVPIDLTRLRQPPPEQYLLAPGDTLGVYVEGILGDPEAPPPVSVPDSPEVPPSIGYPFPIRADGTISLPYVGSVEVSDLTVEQAEQKVIDTYLQQRIVREEDYRIIVTLFRPRYERILVVREDAGQSEVAVANTGLIGFNTRTTISGGRSATGQVVELPAYQNDVLNALARTGGLPGPDAVQEVIIYRSRRAEGADLAGPTADEFGYPCAPYSIDSLAGQANAVRIPLEVRPGMAPIFRPEDIILQTGDIVTIRAREPELFYTGGLIPAGEFQLPFDRDVTVVEALLKARAPVINGGINTSNLNGAVLGSGMGNPSPSLVSIVRKTPNDSQVVIRIDLNEAFRDRNHNILVQAEDVLILQENSDEALTRYITQMFQMDLFFRWLDRGDAVGTGSLVVP